MTVTLNHKNVQEPVNLSPMLLSPKGTKGHVHGFGRRKDHFQSVYPVVVVLVSLPHRVPVTTPFGLEGRAPVPVLDRNQW